MRYGEVLLVRLSDSGAEATVYNTFPLNDCPAELWAKLDTTAIAAENGAQLALLNGPRYWLVFELIDPDGRRWVMQTWSQTVDPTLSLDDLSGLASRLNLSAGWTYEARTLTSPLRVDTTTEAAHVTQDDLANSYSLQTS